MRKSPLPIQLACEAVLFDLDGVLADSTACVERHWRRWAQSHSLDADTVVAASHGLRTADTIRLVAPSLDADIEALRFEEREAIDVQGVAPVRGAARMVSCLPAETWAVVTSGTRAIATNRLRSCNLRIPEVLVTADEVWRGKPDPEGYLRAARSLGFSPRHCVVFEDAPAGIAAALAAGMRVVALTTTMSRADLGGADSIVEDLAGVEVHVNRAGSASRLNIQFAEERS